jgi:hypothetical protein
MLRLFFSSIAFVLVCTIVTATAQELKVKDGVDANLRAKPSSGATLIRKFAPGETVQQQGRIDDWIKVEGGYVQAASVEWAIPLGSRGNPSMRVGSNKVLDRNARNTTTSPNGRLLAAMGLSDKSRITIFDTDSLQSLIEITVPAGVDSQAWEFEFSFIDDNTLLLTNGDRHSGLGRIEDPKTQTVIDVNSGQVIYDGAPLFGYLSRNHVDPDGTILSFTSGRIFRHDPTTYEILESVDIACVDCEHFFERNLYDVLVSRDGRISIAATIGSFPKEYFYTYSTKDGLETLRDHIVNIDATTPLSRGAIERTMNSYGYYGYLPDSNTIILWDIPNDKRTKEYGYVYSVFNAETADLIDRFVSDTSARPLICADGLDVAVQRIELGPDGPKSESVNIRNKTHEVYELASIKVDPASGKPEIARLAKQPKNFPSRLFCLGGGRRLFLGQDNMVVDVRSTPETNPFSLPSASSGYGRFGMIMGDAPVLLYKTANGNSDDLDLDKLTLIAGPALSQNALRMSKEKGFLGPDRSAVLLFHDKQRGVWFMNETGEVSGLSDKRARSVWTSTIRSTNGAALLVMNGERRLSILNVPSRELVPVTGLHDLDAYNAEFGDDRYMAEDSTWWSTSLGFDLSVITFDYSGEYLYVQRRDRRVMEKVRASNGEKVAEIQSEIPCDDSLQRVSLVTPEGLIACLSRTGILIGNIETGKLVAKIETKRAPYYLALDTTGKYLFATDGLATLIYSVASKKLLASLHAIGGPGEELGERRLRIVGHDGWLLLTPEGFYASDGDADAQLRVSYGVERTYPIDKFRDALYRPDLVAEALKGDPEGLVKEAAAKVSLEKILQSGAAPEIRIRGELAGGTVKASAEIEDSGGGIGRIEWRVNGVVQETDEGRTNDVAELFLAGGENRIELVAYNRDNTIQGRSEALSFTVAGDKVSAPRLFVLAVGVDDYNLDQLKLKYAARDAEAVASAFERAGAGLYGEIFVEVLKDQDVTRAVLEAKFRELAKSVRPNDVFVFFSAGHGKTLDGRFFFIPRDFSGTTVTSIREQGIGHSTWQDWFSLIPAQKSLLLFDSCESGSLTDTVVGRELRFRAANDFLGNATGRALIAASSGTGVALEGYKDQGVFAWSVIDALSYADKDANGLINIDELAASIEEMVPRIAEEAFGEKQTPQFKAPMKGFDVVRPIERQ